MARFLGIDVGAGTLDALFLDTASGDQFKFVAKSPTRVLAEQIMACRRGRLLLTGPQMGGGAVTEAIRLKARGGSLMMTRSAAETIHHRMDRVESLGVLLVSRERAKREAKRSRVRHFHTGDVPAGKIKAILKSLGVDPVVDYLGICVQDHGTPRHRVSSLDFRHRILKETIERVPKASAFLFEAGEIPSYLRRMRAAATDGRRIRSGKIYLMDTGMAAILGASSDPSALKKNSLIVLDIATSHTLGALLVGGEIGGFFEYHTHAVTPELLRCLIVDLAEGKLVHERVVAQGGHGAYVRKAVGFDHVECIVITGPKRGIMEAVRMDRTVLGAPFGDNMMTGAAGVVLAMAEREGISIQREMPPGTDS